MGLAITAGLGGLIYTGWEYMTGMLKPFHLAAIRMGFGPHEYAFFGLSAIPGPVLPVLAILMVIATFLPGIRRRVIGRFPMIGAFCNSRLLGGLLFASGLVILLMRGLGHRSALGDLNSALVLALLGLGMVCIVWPSRAKQRLLFGMSAVVATIFLIATMALYGAFAGQQHGRRLLADPPTDQVVEIRAKGKILPSRFRAEEVKNSTYTMRYRDVWILTERPDCFYVLAGRREGDTFVLAVPREPIRLKSSEDVLIIYPKAEPQGPGEGLAGSTSGHRPARPR
ncbi:hypothetical protein OHA77_30920 [Streptosporangium sp. NBC_01639]|uniref:hypothetical protein n=1 Tax=Streptosporangium sp. NBC_01639 TaxID=2975948 RepID=UPI00386C64DC|nr:hypothetical protein OHA77_30920 [Streptosporangium sp. NBC_01639]